MRPSVKKLLLFGSTAPYSGALLALDFVGSRTNGQPYYMLNGATYPRVNNIPGWTYIGGTPAGTGSYAARQDGSLQFFPSYTNLQIYSQTFTTGWSYSNITATDNQYVAPDGTTTGGKLTGASATGSFTIITQTLTPVVGQVFTYSIYAKQVTAGQQYLQMTFSSAGYGATQYANFDLSNGTVTATGSGATASVEPAPNGWYRLIYTATATATGASSMNFFFADGPTMARAGSITGTSANYIALWGGQRELGSTASTYIPTTTAAVTVGTPRITDAGYWAEEARTNLLLRSQEFDNASWTKSATTVTANQAVAPDGTTTADLVVPDTSSSAHQVYQSVTHTVAATVTSIYVKPAGYDKIAIREASTTGGFVAASLTGSGSIIASAVLTGSVTALANGWYRVSATWTATAVSQVMMFYVLGPGYTSGSPVAYNWSGDGTSGVYFWGAQDELGSFATSPIPTTSVAVTRATDVGYINAFSAPTDGTMFVEGAFASFTGSPISVGTNSASDDGIYQASNASAHWNGATVISAGTAVVSPSITRTALSYVGTSSRSISANGSAVTTSATSKGTFNRVAVGLRGSLASTQLYNGPIRRIVIYPRAFANSELQAITTAGAY